MRHTLMRDIQEGVCMGGKVESILQYFLKSMKDYNNSNFNYKR